MAALPDDEISPARTAVVTAAGSSTAASPAAAGPAARAATIGLLATVLFWAGNFTATKIVLTEIPPMAFTGVRFALGAILLMAVLYWREGALRPAPGTLLALTLLGLVGNTLYQYLFIHGLDLTTATNSSLILAGMPTVVAVAAGLLGFERSRSRERWALAIATLGVILIVTAHGWSSHGSDLRGDLMTVAAVFCWASYTLGLRAVVGKMSALAITTWTVATGTPGLVLLGLPGMLHLDWGTVTWHAWLGVAYSTLLSLVVAYLLWNRAVEVLGPSRTSLFSLLTPLFATIIAMLVLGERLVWAHVVGGAMIVGGVLLSRRRAVDNAAVESGKQR